MTVPGADDGDRAAPVLPVGKLKISSRADDALVDAAVDLFDHGLVPVLLKPGKKVPRLHGWPTISYSTADEVRSAFVGTAEGSGLGVLLGNGLADVDLDSETARRAAPLLLPDTTVQSGRPSAARSHWWYTTDDDCHVRFPGPDGKRGVELRANPRIQTAIAPSVHPSGELYRWETKTHVSEATWVPLPELLAAVAAVAIASNMTEVWPGPGSRHEAYLALAGALLRGCHEKPQMIQWTEKIISAIASLTGDEEASRRVAESVRSTIQKLAADVPVTGWPTLLELLMADDAAGAVKNAQAANDRLRDALSIEVVTVTFSKGEGSAPESVSSTWCAVDVSSTIAGLMDGTYVAPEPTVGALSRSDGGSALFYRGRVNGIAGESGCGKTWSALVVVAQELANGQAAIYIDLEDSAVGILGRLLAMGVQPEVLVERFCYVHPEEHLTSVAYADLADLLDTVEPSLFVIDSTGEGLALEGSNPNADEEVARWFRLLPRRVANHPCEPCVLLLDHVVKSDDGGLWPIGSQRKRAAVNGAQYMQRLVGPFDRGTPGSAVLVCAKDRHGHFRTRMKVAELVVAPSGESVSVDLVALAGGGPPSAPVRSTDLMLRISRYLEDHPGSDDRTLRQIRQNVRGKESAVTEALEVLVTEGNVTTSLGARGSTIHTLVKPFGDEHH